MKYARVINMPENPKGILDDALEVSFNHWIDEKGTSDHPGVWQRMPSKLTYEEAFKIVQANKPHWVTLFRNISHLSLKEQDYWEFGGCNIGSNSYGEVFIWIQVEPAIAEEIIQRHNLKIEWY
jgi:hypothetical protein